MSYLRQPGYLHGKPRLYYPKAPRFSSVGCYPLFYVTESGDVLCASCVNRHPKACRDASQPDWCVVASDANWENPELYCDRCDTRIESAYAEDERNQEGGEQ